MGALLLFGLSACDSVKSMTSNVTVGKVIEEFKAAGLEADNPSDLPEKEFGNTRKEAKRILVPALGEDSGGRIFEFKNKEDLEKAKKYYDDLGNGNQMLFSHTYAKGNFLIQMNGDMEDAQFNKYKEVMDKVIK
ncbi:stress protein [Bacillus toyonensis]|nr:stress protein [Bacillus toyonensis]PEN97743.1 stress protein [Bacillus toyonensis]PEU32516.1 stress protein [Bacillus toyonensis]PHD79105.1 stress protein [Bacillus toyonensis]PHE27429.1 stress protein [Bacillus toyonensis]